MNERLKELRLSLGLTQTEFGKKLGVTRAVISGIEYANNKPNESLVKLVCNLFSVREEWLITGEGPRYIDPEDENMIYVDFLLQNQDNALSGMIRKIMKYYFSLDEKGKKVLEDFIINNQLN